MRQRKKRFPTERKVGAFEAEGLGNAQTDRQCRSENDCDAFKGRAYASVIGNCHVSSNRNLNGFAEEAKRILRQRLGSAMSRLSLCIRTSGDVPPCALAPGEIPPPPVPAARQVDAGFVARSAAAAEI